MSSSSTPNEATASRFPLLVTQVGDVPDRIQQTAARFHVHDDHMSDILVAAKGFAELLDRGRPGRGRAQRNVRHAHADAHLHQPFAKPAVGMEQQLAGFGNERADHRLVRIGGASGKRDRGADPFGIRELDEVAPHVTKTLDHFPFARGVILEHRQPRG
jgi:hypothetical protein